MSTLPVTGVESLVAPLKRLRSAVRRHLALRGLARWTTLVVVISLAHLLLDHWLKFALDQRIFMNLAITGVWIWFGWRWIARPATRRLDDAALARLVEQRHGERFDRLSAAMQFAQGAVHSGSPSLIAATVRQAVEVVERFDFLGVLDQRAARRRSFWLVVTGIVIVVGLTLPPWGVMLRTWFARNWLLQDISYQQWTYLTPDGFGADRTRRVAEGAPLTLTVAARGRVPLSARIEWRRADQRGRSQLTRIGRDRFVIDLPPMNDALHFVLVGGDERTSNYTLLPTPRPRVTALRTTVDPPSYVPHGSATYEGETAIEVLSGSSVLVEAELNKPVAGVQLLTPDDVSAAMLGRPTDRQAVARITRPRSGAYAFTLVDEDGFSNPQPLQLLITVAPDPPPEVELDIAHISDVISPEARLPMTVQYRDPLGLETATLVTRVDDGEPIRTTVSSFERGATAFSVDTTIEGAALGLTAGSRFSIHAAATDADPNGPNVGVSNTIAVQVITPDELLERLIRREFDLRREVEQLLAAQRGLGDAVRGVAEQVDGRGPAPEQAEALARRQAWHATRCVRLGQEFQRLLDEMRVNRVATPADQERLTSGVIAPLAHLAEATIPAAEARLRRWSETPEAAGVLSDQDRIVAALQTVLTNLREWEGFRETVKLLEELVADQQDVRDATVEAMEAQLLELLGEVDPSAGPSEGDDR